MAHQHRDGQRIQPAPQCVMAPRAPQHREAVFRGLLGGFAVPEFPPRLFAQFGLSLTIRTCHGEVTNTSRYQPAQDAKDATLTVGRRFSSGRMGGERRVFPVTCGEQRFASRISGLEKR